MARKKLLLVDDDESLREALGKNLEKLGYEVLQASNGRQAQECLMKNPVHLVISDIRMPEMDGIALIGWIKQNYPLPVILITGFSDILETHQAHELGAEEFLVKPFDRAELAGAVERCLGPVNAADSGTLDEYCKVGIEDFVSGRQICFNIFIRLAETRFVKIAHQGEDLSMDRVRNYKSKGIDHLYLRREDFRSYVGFSLALTEAVKSRAGIAPEKKLNLLRHTGEILLERIRHDQPDRELAAGAITFTEATVEILADDPGLFHLLESLNSHTDYQYAHSVAVSFYGVMLARQLGWELPSNQFKVAMGGLFHDIGEKEIASEQLLRPRGEWSVNEVKLFESHPLRGVEILSQMKAIPNEVVHIVKEHHEDGLPHAYPARLKKNLVHPMAKVIAVADAFCERVIRNPHHTEMTAKEALKNMNEFSMDRYDMPAFRALEKLFQ